MSKLIYCNFKTVEQANSAVNSLKQAFNEDMISFLIDNSYKYSQQNIGEYAPQGIPTAVLNQLYGGEAPPQATNSAQATNPPQSSNLTYGEGQSQAENITTVKLSFSDKTPREVLSKIEELGGTNIKSFFS